VIRWAMAYLQGVKEFNAAAVAPDQHMDIVDILARTTALNKPELIKAIAPHWSYVNEDGMPPVDQIMKMQDFWSGDKFHYVEKKVTTDQLFDLSIAKEAKERLEREKPFAN
jgi:NitT/TauT family transport system substrate-binding protein